MSTEFVLPPIVGDCTDGKMTILCETKSMSIFRIDITNALSGETETIEISSDGLTIFSINTGRFERQEYVLDWFKEGKSIYRHSVHFEPNPRRIIFFSCDMLESQPRNPLWRRMFDWRPDLVVHCGDNIYGDPAYGSSMRWARKRENRTEYDIRTRSQYYYSKRYRKTWSRWAKEIGSFPNVFGPDDHEIVDNIQQKILTMEDDEKLVTKIALDTFDLYQGSLTKDVLIYDDGRAWIKGWYLFEDKSVCMAFFDRPHGKRQMARMELFDMLPEHCDYLIAVTGAPPENPTGDDEISNESIVEFLDRIFQWKKAEPGRKVIIVSGDAHFSAVGQIEMCSEESLKKKKKSDKNESKPRSEPRDESKPKDKPESKNARRKRERALARAAKKEVKIGNPSSPSGNVGKTAAAIKKNDTGLFKRLSKMSIPSLSRVDSEKENPFKMTNPPSESCDHNLLLQEMIKDKSETPFFQKHNTYQREVFSAVEARAKKIGNFVENEEQLVVAQENEVHEVRNDEEQLLVAQENEVRNDEEQLVVAHENEEVIVEEAEVAQSFLRHPTILADNEPCDEDTRQGFVDRAENILNDMEEMLVETMNLGDGSADAANVVVTEESDPPIPLKINIAEVSENSIPFVIASPVSSQPWRGQLSEGLALRKYQVKTNVVGPSGEAQVYNYKVDRLIFRRNYITMVITEDGFTVEVIPSTATMATVPQALGMAKFSIQSRY